MTPRTPTPSTALEGQIQAVGQALGPALRAVVEAVPGHPRGPQDLATALGLDKVLTSRLLKTTRQRDPMAVLHFAPGPEPLRRFLRAAAKRGVPAEVVKPARTALESFVNLLQREVGDRSSLTAILAAWLPEARAEFELRRKQAAFRAMSELKGSAVDLDLSSAFLAPSSATGQLDVVWVIGMFGLRRLRPGVGVKLSSRRTAPTSAERRPRSLAGDVLEGTDRGRLDEFCFEEPARFRVETVDEVVHYILDGEEYGPDSATDLIFAEVNEGELPHLDRAAGRRAFAYSDVAVPAKRLVFDLFVHEEVYAGRDPELILYDTSIHGVADPNDRTRDIDQLNLVEHVAPLGRGIAGVRLPAVPTYVDLLTHVHAARGWDPDRFRGYRVAIDYPLYGSQVVLSFDA